MNHEVNSFCDDHIVEDAALKMKNCQHERLRKEKDDGSIV
jgi:hypothetical protein